MFLFSGIFLLCICILTFYNKLIYFSLISLILSVYFSDFLFQVIGQSIIFTTQSTTWIVNRWYLNNTFWHVKIQNPIDTNDPIFVSTFEWKVHRVYRQTTKIDFNFLETIIHNQTRNVKDPRTCLPWSIHSSLWSDWCLYQSSWGTRYVSLSLCTIEMPAP